MYKLEALKKIISVVAYLLYKQQFEDKLFINTKYNYHYNKL